jgi:hypothetical protein
MTNHYPLLVSYILVIQTISLVIVAFPIGPPHVWQRLKKRWRSRESKLILKRRMRAEEKLKKYWDIDIRKLK